MVDQSSVVGRRYRADAGPPVVVLVIVSAALLVPLFGIPADPVLHGVDGVHVTLDGQAAIARALVERLTASDVGR